MHIPHEEGAISLDRAGGEFSFVSHAHSDHLNGVRKSSRIIASPETVALGALSGKPELPKGVRLLEAGHILGSRQIFAECDGVSSLYTGDLRTRDSVLFKGAENAECDRLIIECTYADPEYEFPDSQEIYSQMGAWVRENAQCNLMIGGYALGKAQEIIKILNTFGVCPVVDKNIERFNEIYEKFGVPLDRAVVGTDAAEEAMSHPFVGVVEMKRANRMFAGKLERAFGRKTLSAVATGWALKRRFDAHKGFVLSDHADFSDLKEYVQRANPSELVLVHGDGSELAREFPEIKTVKYA
jgi:putative mRNA 3-end processing factor